MNSPPISAPIAVSVISHGHGPMVVRLIESLRACPLVAQVILTLNIPEPSIALDGNRLIMIANDTPKGFAANHNAAFARCRAPYFCVVNPDITLARDPFADLLATLTAENGSLAAPLVLSPQGQIEDSIRYFPTFRLLIKKACGLDDGRYPVCLQHLTCTPEWVAGMFMLFRSQDFRLLGGFDEGFFLYYEDVDICARAWKRGMRIIACPGVSVTHDARRASRRDARHLRWHLASMLRYACKHWGRLPSVPREG